MPAEFKYAVFLSESAKDKTVVRASSLFASNEERAGVRFRTLHLADGLRQDGLKVWFDQCVLKAGDSILAKIEEGFPFQPSAFILQPFLDALIKVSLAKFLYLKISGL